MKIKIEVSENENGKPMIDVDSGSARAKIGLGPWADHYDESMGHCPETKSDPGRLKSDPIDEAIDGFNMTAPKIIGVLLAVCGCVLLFPHLGAIVHGFGEVAGKALWGVGAGFGFLIIGLTVWGLGKLGYGFYWRHRERCAVFEIEKRRAMSAAIANPDTVIPGGFVRGRVINHGADRPGAGRIENRRMLEIQ